MSLTTQEREAIDHILDLFIPHSITELGLTVNREFLKKRIWFYVERDPWIQLKLMSAYTKLRQVFT